jgi:hypothetical protein
MAVAKPITLKLYLHKLSGNDYDNRIESLQQLKSMFKVSEKYPPEFYMNSPYDIWITGWVPLRIACKTKEIALMVGMIIPGVEID